MTLRDWTPAEQAAHRAELWRAIGGTGPVPAPPLSGASRHRGRLGCANCVSGRHGWLCLSWLLGKPCPCRCRAVLGMDGPFPFGDPTAPAATDQVVA